MDPSRAEKQQLRAENAALRAELQELEAVRAELHQEQLKLEAITAVAERQALEIAKLKRQLLGPKSERVTEDHEAQLHIFGRLPEPEKPKQAGTKPTRRKRKGTGRRNLADSPLPKRRVDGKAPVEGCPCCKGPLKHIGDAVSYRWEIIPARAEVLQIVQGKYACPSCPGEGVVASECPESFALPKAMCGNGLLALVLADKYGDHIPLNRQVKRLDRLGIDVNTATLCGWVRAGAEAMRPIAQQIEREVLAGNWLRADATGFPVLDGTKGRAARHHLWAFGNHEHVAFQSTPDKEGTTVAEVLEGFDGTLIVDGASDFNLVAKAAGVQRAGCWAHARRKFFEASNTDPGTAAVGLAAIRRLFQAERLAKDGSVEDRQRPARALRQPVVGRKNWLFASSEGGAQSACVLFTLVGSCLLQGLDPRAYLQEVLGRLESDPAVRLTPAAIRAERENRLVG